MNRRTLHVAFALVVASLCLALVGPAWAQDTGLNISLRRDFGYGLGKQIQGQFTLSATGPSDLASVSFRIDGKEIGRAGKAPFQIAINTDNYSLGEHVFTAIGTTTGGRALTSNQVSVEIVSGQSAGGMLTWVFGAIFGVIVLIVLLQFLLTRRMAGRLDPSAPRKYGLAGGAICPKCGRPVALSPLGLNMLTGKLQACPYCGKWSIMKRASPQQLAAAEAAERRSAGPAVQTESAEEKLRRQIEESKYH